MKRTMSYTNGEDSIKSKHAKYQREIGNELRKEYAKRVVDFANDMLLEMKKINDIDQEMINEAQERFNTKTEGKGGDIDTLKVSFDIFAEVDGQSYDEIAQFFSSLRTLAQEYAPATETTATATQAVTETTTEATATQAAAAEATTEVAAEATTEAAAEAAV